MSVAELADRVALALDPAELGRRLIGASLDPWQRDALRSDARRALWLCARQTGKSSMAAILALHEATYRPGSLTLVVSPSLRQSSELFRTVLSMLDRLPARPAMIEENRLSLVTARRSRIVSLPSSESTVRGFAGVTLLIEDEAARVSDALFAATRPMLATTGGRHILLSTPHGTRGHFYELWEHGGDAWARVKITAEECPRISSEFLEEEQASLGSWWFDQEYRCVFLDAETQAFTRVEVDKMFAEPVSTWDLGASAWT